MAAKKAPTAKKETAKKPSLDIKDEMYFADMKQFNWLDGQDPELQKTFSPLIAMKWFSVVQGDTDTMGYHIFTANEYLNIGLFDWPKEHHDVLWRLMCAQGLGAPQRHGWIPLASKKKTANKVDQVFIKLYPHLNSEEITLLRGKYDTESFKQLLRDMGMPDADIKPLVDEFKKING